MNRDSGMTRQVDGYLRKQKRWGEELGKLREIVLGRGLVEEMKWRVPCYTLEGKNVVILGAFKEWCVITFVKGALLKNAEGILVRPGENTQAARMIRFTGVREIVEMEEVLKAYLEEAVKVEKAGLKVKLKAVAEFAVPGEFQKKLEEMPALKKAFEKLTPGRRKGYLLYFSGAKQSKTREGRVEKCVGRILEGKGLED